MEESLATEVCVAGTLGGSVSVARRYFRCVTILGTAVAGF